jgi:transcription-repair coupling factor (superfamily II helicase)
MDVNTQTTIGRELAASMSIGPLPVPLKALVLASVFRQERKTLLWLVESTDEMYQALENLSAFLGPEDITLYPPPDVRPYQDDSMSREIAARRIAVLSRLLRNEPVVVIAPFDAIVMPLIPTSELTASVMRIEAEQEMDRDGISRKLVQMGYTREALVDDISQFSMRGSIVDIYSPGMTDPVRIDLWGDTVTSIKAFNLVSQRSGKDMGEAVILPASEILMDTGHVKNARPWLRRMRDPSMAALIGDIEQGIYPPGIESYLPLFYETPATFFDYLPAGSMSACPDHSILDLWWENVLTRHVHGYERLGEHQGRYLPPDEQLIGREAVFTGMSRMARRISTSFAQSGQCPDFRSLPALPAGKTSDFLMDTIKEYREEGFDVFLFTGSQMLSERVSYALTSRGMPPADADGPSILNRTGWGGRLFLVESVLSTGFVLPSSGLALISADEILGVKKRKKRASGGGTPLLNPFTQLNVGDPVVHQENGIGIFRGVTRLELDGFKSDFILLEYLGGDKLYVPVYRLGLLQRYIGDTDAFMIDKLGGTRWTKATQKARESVAKLANELLEIYAKRESSVGYTYDTSAAAVEGFEDTFPYEETDDQLKAVEDVYGDMASRRPMDRLICGDVGYGKTEVALRAAFAATMSGRQVCMLVPTTLLARQHLNTFKERLSPWPFRVEGISSFSSSTHNKEVIADLENGRVDIIIGTHALLSDKVKFRDLGLLIVDEEHRFGVKDKERIKAKRAEVDILTLTATPIPRTLNMAISGIRDLSIIETPPLDRKSIETVVSRFDEETIGQVITRELSRGGQVFFVHNQVVSIEGMARRIEVLVPGARVGVAHGQMSRTELEHVMERFLDRTVNVLVTSAIISSGIDIPSANTIIINRADKFGLADLYQLRGRVGRSKVKGFALLLTPELGQITRDARKRLAAIKEYESLGAGFQMALRDMEIRGVGDILGRAQWGHVTAIGYELYQQMLREAVESLQGKEIVTEVDPEIQIQVNAYIPEEYCPDGHLRLGLYKRLFSAEAHELPGIREEITDLYGEMPQPVRELITIAEIRDRMKKLRLKKIERQDNRLRLYLGRDSLINLQDLVDLVMQKFGRLYPQGIAEFPMGEENASDEIREILYRIA